MKIIFYTTFTIFKYALINLKNSIYIYLFQISYTGLYGGIIKAPVKNK